MVALLGSRYIQGREVLSMKFTDGMSGPCETTAHLQIMNLCRHVGTSFLQRTSIAFICILKSSRYEQSYVLV